MRLFLNDDCKPLRIAAGAGGSGPREPDKLPAVAGTPAPPDVYKLLPYGRRKMRANLEVVGRLMRLIGDGENINEYKDFSP